jgi:hypothetical protein
MAPRLRQPILLKLSTTFLLVDPGWISTTGERLRTVSGKKLTTGVTLAESEKMMEGKLRAQKRDLRRHHAQRKKAWVRKRLGH